MKLNAILSHAEIDAAIRQVYGNRFSGMVIDKVRLFDCERVVEADVTFKDAPPKKID